MQSEPIHKRKYHVFLSHATSDKKIFVNKLYEWFAKIAKIPTWYDQSIIAGGASLSESIGKAIPECRSMVLILSPASMNSPWVQKEYRLAESHKIHYHDFKIIPILINNCELPPFLQDSFYIDARNNNNQLTIDLCQNLLQALYPFDPSVEFKSTSDIYVSRTWRANETKFADRICQKFIQSKFRLVGDAKDHPGYKDSRKRVENIISSCGGLLAILPYRENNPDSYLTSPYCLDEISIASKYNLPMVIIAEPGVTFLSDYQKLGSYFYQVKETNELDNNSILDAVEYMKERWKKSDNEHYVFFATNFDDLNRNQTVRQLIQQITGISCRIGENIQYSERSIQEGIADLIRRASLVIADISQDNINTLIETGIARGAKVDYRMIAHASSKSPRKKPAFMFRDKQIEYYLDDAELLGSIHRLTYPFRRRILNFEIKG